MSTTTPDWRLIRQARLAEALTVAWMVLELVVALARHLHGPAPRAHAACSLVRIYMSDVLLRASCSTVSSAGGGPIPWPPWR